jgi:hypothetical protein
MNLVKQYSDKMNLYNKEINECKYNLKNFEE